MKPEIDEFLGRVESYARRPFSEKEAVAQFMELAWSSNRTEVFEEIVFYAKFMTKSAAIMMRIGRGAEGYDKLAAEYSTATEKVLTLMRTLAKDSPEQIKIHLTDLYLKPGEENLGRFMALLKDLTWVKNWTVDGKPLPWQRSSPGEIPTS